jgi:cell wall-associated NlpC family hydrolase
VTRGPTADRRLTPATARIALRGQAEAPALTDGVPARVVLPVANLLARPGGPRDRQVLYGAEILVIDRDAGHAFVQAAADGYCGWLDADALREGGAEAATHRVSAPATHLYPEATIKVIESNWLPMNARLRVIAAEGALWLTEAGYVPAPHLQPLTEVAADPVTVAESLLGSPYLWGGNSRAGVDCSGLVQLAHHAAGRACPGDSDLQAHAFAGVLGQPLAEAEPLRRGDLVFWKGHVALVVDAARLVHANGHTMSVAYEGITEAINRIAAQGGGPVTVRARPD